MKKLVVAMLAAVAAFAASPRTAEAAGQCGLPDHRTMWIDFADGSVPFWETFARPGIIAAAANLIYPPKLRERGAQTVYWDMYLNNRVGTPSAPRDPSTIVERANRLFDYAVQSTGCATPVIAENELFGASLVTPWSATNAQYRANVLLYLRTLAARGARPFLLISSKPYTAGEAGDWWRQVAEVADLVPEVYFPAPSIYRQGAIVGSRRLRVAFRNAILAFTELGIPARRLGIMLGFQTGRGAGGREGLEPAHAWFETVKWQALAARQVANEWRLGSVWSWGWGHWTTAAVDPDKAVAACVYLWTRSRNLCNAPALAGPEFNQSLREGQIDLPRGIQCQVGRRQITTSAVTRLQALTGDRQLALTILFARAVERNESRPSARDVLAAERTVIALRFGGSAAAYRSALAQARASVTLARGILGDSLRRAEIEARLPVRRPSGREISAFYFAFPELLARPVEVRPAPWWLGGRKVGIALSSLAPERVFKVKTGRLASVRSLDGTYSVRTLGEPMPLGALPLERARPAISAA
ncbi:MAG: hypothetical protein M3321_12120, partial [Actinomycetota bacterium]|nr:hypothetical protein [Actinomycetota bacterium]